jgi:hypothetical protein
VWTRTAARQFTVGLTFYAYDLNGEFAGNPRIREYITLLRDHNSYTSYSTFEFFTPDGVLVDSGCSFETATRFPF